MEKGLIHNIFVSAYIYETSIVLLNLNISKKNPDTVKDKGKPADLYVHIMNNKKPKPRKVKC